MARPRHACAALFLAVLQHGAVAQASTGVLTLGALGQLRLQAGTLLTNVSSGGALGGSLLQTVGAAGSGVYALLANAGSASAAGATLYQSRFSDGSTGATPSVGATPFAAAGSTTSGAVGLAPAVDGTVRVVQLQPHGPAAQLYFDPVGTLPGGCNAVGATAFDAAQSQVHAVCVTGAVATGAQSLLSYDVLTGALVRTVPLPPPAALRVSALTVEPTSGDVFTLGCRAGASQPEVGRVALGAAAVYAGAVARAGSSAPAAFTAALAAAVVQGATKLLSYGVILQGNGVAVRTANAVGAIIGDTPLTGGPLLDAFWLGGGATPSPTAAHAPPPSPPSPPLSLASLQAQIAALRAAALPPSCAPGQLLQCSTQAGWRCAAPVSVTAPGGFCHADGSGASSVACDVQPAALTPPTCLPPGGQLLAFTVAEGWACACAPGYSGTSCDTLAAGGAAPAATCAPPPCAPPAGSGLYSFDNVTRAFECICSQGFAQSTDPANPCV